MSVHPPHFHFMALFAQSVIRTVRPQLDHARQRQDATLVMLDIILTRRLEDVTHVFLEVTHSLDSHAFLVTAIAHLHLDHARRLADAMFAMQDIRQTAHQADATLVLLGRTLS